MEALDGVTEEDRDRLSQILTLMKSNLTASCRPPVEDKEAHYG